MKLTCIPGKNYKKFIHIKLENKEDLIRLEAIRTAVTRTEFKPFIKSFNKNVTQSYLLNEVFVPSSFIQEISKKAIPAMSNPKPIIENSDLLFNNNINREEFNDWLNSLELPEYINLYDEKYEYQPESVFRALLFKLARIEATTGAGKTLITYLYSRYLYDFVINKLEFSDRNKILIITPRTDLTKQTVNALLEFDEGQAKNGKALKITSIYANSKYQAEADIVIGNYQSIKNYEKDWFEQFGVLIIDEIHTAKAYSIKTEIYDKITNAEFFFGMTGTYPEEKTLDYLNIVAMFGPSVLVKQTKEATEDGIIAPVKIAQVKINYFEDKDFSKNLKESNIIGTEKYRLEKTFFQNNNFRNNIIMDCISKIEGNQVVLVESVEYIMTLMELAKLKFSDKKIFKIHGTVSQKERDEIKKYMIENEDGILFATYGTMSTGINIPNIMSMHFPDGGKSRIRIKQSVGRGVRLHPKKEYLTVFDYQDEMKGSSYRNHWLERNKLYAEEGHQFSFKYEYNI